MKGGPRNPNGGSGANATWPSAGGAHNASTNHPDEQGRD